MTSKQKLNCGPAQLPAHGIFEEYFWQQAARKKAITPGQKKALIQRLRQELSQEGRIPSLGGPIRLDITYPMVKAAILAAQLP